jgi:hypothetical protein
MRVSIVSLLLFLAALPPCTHADAFYEIVQYRCDTKGNYLQVQLLGAYNEEGQALTSTKDENTWSPWQLVEEIEDERYIKKTKTIQKTCVLSDGTYMVEIGPNPCNYNIQGMNGAMMMAWARVTKDGKELTRENFGACGVDGEVTTKLQIRPGQKPIIGTKSGDDYFK